MHDAYLGLSAEEFAALVRRYVRFQDTCSDPNEEPVKVFSPIPKKSLEELLLIREVSKDLEKKKEEDMKKAAQIAAERKETEKTEEKEGEKSEDITEEEKPKPETEK